MGTSPVNPYQGMKPTPYAIPYNGLIGEPARYPRHLTMYGAFSDPSNLTDAAHGGFHTTMNPKIGQHAGEEPSNVMTRNFSNRTATTAANESFLSSEVELHPSSGVPLGVADGAMPVMNYPQTKTFQELGAERGIMEWNNTVPDVRWLTPSPKAELRPDEFLLSAGAGTSTAQEVITAIRHRAFVREKRLRLIRDLDETQREMERRQEFFQLDPSIWGLEYAYASRMDLVDEKGRTKE